MHELISARLENIEQNARQTLRDIEFIRGFCDGMETVASDEFHYSKKEDNKHLNGGEKILINSQLIGERIKEAREKKALSQRALADKLAVSQPAVVQWEKGYKIPNTLMMNALADVLDVTTDYLNGR